MPAASFRTPSDPDFVEALGFTVWNFLYLEEAIVRLLSLLRPDVSLSEWRSNAAFGKGVALGRAAKGATLSPQLYADIQSWLRRYETMVQMARNAVVHGHPYTVHHDERGWRAGLGYTDRSGAQHDIARSPDDLYKLAGEIDALMLELGQFEHRL